MHPVRFVQAVPYRRDGASARAAPSAAPPTPCTPVASSWRHRRRSREEAWSSGGPEGSAAHVFFLLAVVYARGPFPNAHTLAPPRFACRQQDDTYVPVKGSRAPWACEPEKSRV
ncbi:unnamed protein product [Prorocentrum cordatum]|uniref:Uncharacterized protein n=1 Tax=Prorocentrum cordatum TaxID=2364126 RepID=A0ABN9XVA4_9DINO|nr:unnamed protein product [Polarella glacialis]